MPSLQYNYHALAYYHFNYHHHIHLTSKLILWWFASTHWIYFMHSCNSKELPE